MTVVRLAWALLCFFFALLCVVPAQSYLLWQLTVLATEFSVWLVLAALITLVPGWRRNRTSRRNLRRGHQLHCGSDGGN